MIDTIILTIKKPDFTITDPDKFSPATDILDKSELCKPLMTFIQNPTKEDYKKGVYKPRLTIYRRIGNISLRIEFSVPKLMFLNNVDELEDKDFPDVIKKLDSRLLDMGILVASNTLGEASVSGIHFGKNIPLTDYYTASFVIKQLEKVDLHKRLDLNKRDFRNEGHGLYFHTDSYEIIVYDKIADLKKSQKRAFDKEPTIYQPTLFEPLQEKVKELLRLEIRIGNKIKLLNILKTFGYERDQLIFKNLFSQDLAKKVLQKFWQDYFEDKRLKLLDLKIEPDELLEQILKRSGTRKISLLKALGITGAYVVGQKGNIRKLRSTIEQYYSPRTWQRLKKDIKKLDTIEGINSYKEISNQINNCLNTFDTFRLKDVQI